VRNCEVEVEWKELECGISDGLLPQACTGPIEDGTPFPSFIDKVEKEVFRHSEEERSSSSFASGCLKILDILPPWLAGE
jgi:hypothetical protein